MQGGQLYAAARPRRRPALLRWLHDCLCNSLPCRSLGPAHEYTVLLDEFTFTSCISNCVGQQDLSRALGLVEVSHRMRHHMRRCISRGSCLLRGSLCAKAAEGLLATAFGPWTQVGCGPVRCFLAKIRLRWACLAPLKHLATAVARCQCRRRRRRTTCPLRPLTLLALVHVMLCRRCAPEALSATCTRSAR